MIVTIGRKYGSGGRMTGEKLAKLLNYRFYDRELLKIAARDIGMHEDVVQNFDEVHTSTPPSRRRTRCRSTRNWPSRSLT